jgi:hypothetical protein
VVRASIRLVGSYEQFVRSIELNIWPSRHNNRWLGHPQYLIFELWMQHPNEFVSSVALNKSQCYRKLLLAEHDQQSIGRFLQWCSNWQPHHEKPSPRFTAETLFYDLLASRFVLLNHSTTSNVITLVHAMPARFCSANVILKMAHHFRGILAWPIYIYIYIYIWLYSPLSQNATRRSWNSIKCSESWYWKCWTAFTLPQSN